MILLVTPEDSEMERVRELGTEMLGASVKQVTRLAGSVANRDYKLMIDGRPPVIMKLGPAEELAREVWTLERLTAWASPFLPWSRTPHEATLLVDRR